MTDTERNKEIEDLFQIKSGLEAKLGKLKSRQDDLQRDIRFTETQIKLASKEMTALRMGGR